MKKEEMDRIADRLQELNSLFFQASRDGSATDAFLTNLSGQIQILQWICLEFKTDSILDTSTANASSACAECHTAIAMVSRIRRRLSNCNLDASNRHLPIIRTVSPSDLRTAYRILDNCIVLIVDEFENPTQYMEDSQ